MLINAEVPNPIPAGYAVYQLDAVQYGADSFAGWKMVKQKTVPAVDDKGQPIKGQDGKQLKSQVDDPDATVIYDSTSQLLRNASSNESAIAQILKTAANQSTTNADLIKANATQQLINAQIMQQIAQLGGTK